KSGKNFRLSSSSTNPAIECAQKSRKSAMFSGLQLISLRLETPIPPDEQKPFFLFRHLLRQYIYRCRYRVISRRLSFVLFLSIFFLWILVRRRASRSIINQCSL